MIIVREKNLFECIIQSVLCVYRNEKKLIFVIFLLHKTKFMKQTMKNRFFGNTQSYLCNSFCVLHNQKKKKEKEKKHFTKILFTKKDLFSFFFFFFFWYTVFNLNKLYSIEIIVNKLNYFILRKYE